MDRGWGGSVGSATMVHDVGNLGECPCWSRKGPQVRVQRSPWEPWHFGDIYSSDLSISHWALQSWLRDPRFIKKKEAFSLPFSNLRKQKKMPVYQPVEGKARLPQVSLRHNMEWACSIAPLREAVSHLWRKERWRVNTSLCFCQGRGHLVSLPHPLSGRGRRCKGAELCKL